MLIFVLIGYCGADFKGKPALFESDEYWGEDLYLEVCEHKIGYDGVNVTQVPFCHDAREY